MGGEPVLLICPPYAPLERPSLGLSVLKAALAQHQVGCQVVYANLSFAERIGVHAYDVLSRTNSNDLAADWTFRVAAFPDAAVDEAAYFEYVREGIESFAHLLPKVGLDGTMRELVERVSQHARPFVDEFTECVVAGRPHIVGCGSTFQQHVAALAILRAVKRRAPDIITVLGGANCEAEMGVATHYECPWVDYVVSGEAEEAFPVLCLRLLGGCVEPPVEEIPLGVIGPPHRRATTGYSDLFRCPPRAVLADMNQAPVPDFDDYFAWLEATVRHRIEPGLMMETSRGCWWGAVSHCTFCGLNGESMSYRQKSPERMVSEISTLVARYNVPRVYMVDNILPHSYLGSVTSALASKQNAPHIFYETKANLKRSHLESLASANIRWIQPGIESFDDDILKAMGKGTTARQNILALKSARACGINVYWLLLYDFPDELDSKYEFMASWLPLIAHLQPPRALSFVQFVRFSPYERRRERYGLKLNADRGYTWVYPWARESIDNFAYYFDDYSRGRDRIEFHHERPPRRRGLRALRSVFLEWTAQWPHFGLDGRETMAKLFVEDSGSALTITDTRLCAPEPSRVLNGLHRALCLICDDAPPEAGVAARLEGRFGIVVSEDILRLAIDDLLRWKLLLRLGKFLIGLPLFGRPTPMPLWTAYPGGRVISREECLVRDNLPALGLFARLAVNGLADSTPADPDPLAIAAVIANCWLDRGFQDRLLQSGASVLRESGIGLRQNAAVRIVIDDTRRLHFVLARSPLDQSLRVHPLPPAPSFLQLYAYIYEAARCDESFRRKLLARPKQTLRDLGADLGDDIEVMLYEATAAEAYLSVPLAGLCPH
jgi:magnesium-protoporphyrin IX monomethyl ester (oxidative) cyclase